MEKERDYLEIRKLLRDILNEYLEGNVPPEHYTYDYFEKLAEVKQNIILALPENYPIEQDQLLEIIITAVMEILTVKEVMHMIRQHQLDVVKNITKKLNNNDLIFTKINTLINKQLEYECENNLSVKS